MSLQIALVLLGATALVLVIIVSFIHNRPSLGAGRFSSSRIIGLLKPKLAGDDSKKTPRYSYREPSLVPAAQFRLEPIRIRQFQATRATRSDASDFDTDNSAENGSKMLLDENFSQLPIKIDYWAKMTGETAAMCYDALSVFRHHEPQLEHAHLIHGRSELTKAWVNLEDGSSSDAFTDLVVSVQLVSDQGAVTGSELTRTNSLIYELSEKFDRKCQFNMTPEEAIIHAENLDRFCKNYDLLVIIVISAISEKQFRRDAIQLIAEESNMYLGDEGMYHFSNLDTVFNGFTLADRFEPGKLDASTINDSSTNELVLFMSVPRVVDPVTVFDQMTETALHLSSKLSGQLLDPDGDPISKDNMCNIREQVEHIHQIFRSVGIETGSPDALRLF